MCTAAVAFTCEINFDVLRSAADDAALIELYPNNKPNRMYERQPNATQALYSFISLGSGLLSHSHPSICLAMVFMFYLLCLAFAVCVCGGCAPRTEGAKILTVRVN